MRLTYLHLTHLRRRMTTVAAALLLAGGLAACSSEDPEPAAGADSATPAAEATTTPAEDAAEDAGERQGSASLDLGDESFFFTLAVCMITDDEVLASGPGRNNVTSDSAYLDVDLVRAGGDTSGGVQVNVGTTSAMTSTDDQRSFSTHAGGEFGFLYVDDRLDVEGEFDTTGAGGTRPGRLTVNCE